MHARTNFVVHARQENAPVYYLFRSLSVNGKSRIDVLLASRGRLNNLGRANVTGLRTQTRDELAQSTRVGSIIHYMGRRYPPVQ